MRVYTPAQNKIAHPLSQETEQKVESVHIISRETESPRIHTPSESRLKSRHPTADSEQFP